LPGEAEKAKESAEGSALMRSSSALPLVIGESARTVKRMYSRSRMLSGVKSV